MGNSRDQIKGSWDDRSRKKRLESDDQEERK